MRTVPLFVSIRVNAYEKGKEAYAEETAHLDSKYSSEY